MKIAFFSNFLNDHQIPFCDAMYRLTDGNFTFVATEQISQDRLDMGFKNANDIYPYVVKTYADEESFQLGTQLGLDSDVVIIGSAPDIFIKSRLEANKLTFRYCERFFKEGRFRILDPRVFICRYRMDFKNRKKNLYMLCASAYTAPDCRFIFSYPSKTYKWGYFPEVKAHNVKTLILSKQNQPISILWAGRMLKWKHPETAIYVARKLKEEGYNFTLDMLGGGEQEASIQKLIKKYSLCECVHLLGVKPHDEVIKRMEKSEIFLFTSDRNEGWGAVLNEAMNSCCAVVANRAIGSVPFLINDGENGLIYDKKVSVFNQVKKLIDDNELRRKMQEKAYDTLFSVWNAEVASKRLLAIINQKLGKGEAKYIDGPCSKAN